MNIIFGLITFVIVMPNVFGYAGVLTQHPRMKQFFPAAIQLALISNIVHSLVAVAQSRLVFCNSGIQSMNILFLALMANIVGNTVVDDEKLFPTMLFIFATSSILKGLCYLIIGKLDLLFIIQYVPYPVMAGFRVVVGVCITQAAVAVCTDHTFGNLSEIMETFTSGLWVMALPALGVAILIMFISSRSNHSMIVPGCLLMSYVAFWAIVGLKGTSIPKLRQDGHLFPEMKSVSILNVWSSWRWDLVQYDVLPSLLPNLFFMIVLNVVNSRLNISGLEMSTSMTIDSKRELIGAGISNILSGLLGGYGGSVTFTMTNFCAKNKLNRLCGLVSALLGIGLVLTNLPVILYIPRFFFGSALFYMGLDMVWCWLYKPFTIIPLFEFSLLMATAVSVLMLGNNVGMPVSIAIGAIFFAYQFSQVNPIKKILQGVQLFSKVQRPYTQRKILSKHTQKMVLYQLQGYLFFGSVKRIMKDIELVMGQEPTFLRNSEEMPLHQPNTLSSLGQSVIRFMQQIHMAREDRHIIRVEASEDLSEKFKQEINDFIEGEKEKDVGKELSYLIFDFSSVHGMDSSASAEFRKIVMTSSKNNMILLLCGLQPAVENVLRKHGIISDQNKRMQLFSELDLAIEWCEDNIIRDKVKTGVRDELCYKKPPNKWTGKLRCPQQFLDYQPSFTTVLVNHIKKKRKEINVEECMESIFKYFVKRKLEDKEILYTFGDFGRSIYYLKGGQLCHYGINEETGEKTRDFKTTKGSFVGELSKFLGIPHDLSCEAEGPCTLYELTHDNFLKMQKEDRELAFAVYTAVVQSLCLTFHIYQSSNTRLYGR